MIVSPRGGALIAAILLFISGVVFVAVGLLAWNAATVWHVPLGIALAGFGFAALRGATGRWRARRQPKHPARRR